MLVIDTRASHREADELIDEIEAFTNLPVAWLVNTHWHWDHAFGNSRFPGAEIWGHRLCREALIDLGAEMVEEVADMFREDGNDTMADDIKRWSWSRRDRSSRTQ